jgi:hypothetical protein
MLAEGHADALQRCVVEGVLAWNAANSIRAEQLLSHHAACFLDDLKASKQF